MSSYNIYTDLGIDRARSTSDIAAELDMRLAETPADNAAEVDRLTTARSLFGYDARRQRYDAALDCGDAIDISTFRRFAAGENTASAWQTPAPQQQQPAQSQSGFTVQLGNSEQPSNSKTIRIDKAFFAAAPGRERSSSVMWAIGWVIISLAWLYVVISLFTADTSSSSAIEEYVDGADFLMTIIANLAFAFFHTCAMLSILETVWTIRKIAGKRMGL